MEYFQYRFGNRSAKKRIGARTEFINEHHGFSVGMLGEMLHFSEVSAVGTQIALDGLVITNIGEYLSEYTHARYRIGGDGQTCLNHQLQQSDRFHTNRFSTGVRP